MSQRKRAQVNQSMIINSYSDNSALQNHLFWAETIDKSQNGTIKSIVKGLENGYIENPESLRNSLERNILNNRSRFLSLHRASLEPSITQSTTNLRESIDSTEQYDVMVKANRRYKKQFQPKMETTFAGQGIYNQRSVAPFAVELINKKESLEDLSPQQQKRLQIQEQNRKRYHYKKFLKNRYLQMENSLKNSAERYKMSTIDLSLPEINHIQTKEQILKDKRLSNSTSKELLQFYQSQDIRKNNDIRRHINYEDQRDQQKMHGKGRNYDHAKYNPHPTQIARCLYETTQHIGLKSLDNTASMKSMAAGGAITIEEYQDKVSNPYNSYKKRIWNQMNDKPQVNYDNLKITLIKPIDHQVGKKTKLKL